MDCDITSRVSWPDIDFLIIGAAKSSTTWLQATLQQASNVVMPDPELHFFSREYDRGIDWYRAQFPQKSVGQIMGEKSNSYLSDPSAASRIQNSFPDVLLVVMLRNPVMRAYSDYCMLYRRGTVSNDIDNYLDPGRASFRRFIDDGLYAQQLRTYLDYFPKESILLLFFEECRNTPQDALDRLAHFLGREDGWLSPFRGKVKDSSAAMVPRPLRAALKPLRPILDPVRNTAPIQGLRGLVARGIKYPELKAELAGKLTSYYAEDVRNLEDICGRSLHIWKNEGST